MDKKVKAGVRSAVHPLLRDGLLKVD